MTHYGPSTDLGPMHCIQNLSVGESEKTPRFASRVECILAGEWFSHCCFLSLHQPLRQGGSLLKTPGSNLSFKQFVELRRRPTTHMLVFRLALYSASYVPGSLGNEEPNRHREWSTNPCVEPASLKAPIPILSVNHFWNHKVQNDAYNA